jgi:hypothetical protein
MTRCAYVSEEELASWYDGLPGNREDIASHVEGCANCSAVLSSWRASGEQLRSVVDTALGEVEPLIALQSIRQRIAAGETGSFAERVSAWWEELWTFNRRAVQGVVAAAALGALTAPAVAYWMGAQAEAPEVGGPHVASVVIEELEYAGSARAVVYHPAESTTIIWVEPGASTSSKQ